MGENRLSALAILSIESDLVESLSFGDIFFEFPSMKARRTAVLLNTAKDDKESQIDVVNTAKYDKRP